MALVKLGGQIVSIRGRLGGVYFKSGPDGTHIQAMPRHVNRPHSMLAMAGIKAWTGMSALWSMALLLSYMAAWSIFALLHDYTSEDGEEKKLTAYNWYMHYAMMFPEAYTMPFWKPPHAPGDLPHYVTTGRGQWMFEHAETDWPADLAGGFYWPGMDYNGAPSFRTDDYEWFIWWKDPVWVVSKSLGWEPAGTTFYSPDGEIEGWYKNPVTNRLTHVYGGRRGR